MVVITGYLVDAGDRQTTELRVGRSFNISLKFTPIRHNDEVTYLTMSEGREDRGPHEDGWLCSIPIRHPAGITINESNWAGFLQHNVYKLGSGKWEMPKSVLPNRGFTLLEAFPSLGSYCFLIESVGMSFAVVVPRPDGTTAIYQRYPKGFLVKHPFGERLKHKSIQFNSEGIYIQSDLAMQGMMTGRDNYSAKFISKLPPHRELQILLDKKAALDFKVCEFADVPGNMMVELDAISKERTFREIKGLVPKSFRGFEYFESVDGGLILTLQKDPVNEAFVAIRTAIDDLAWHDEGEQRTAAEQKYNWTCCEYVLSKPSVDNDRLTLLRCIEIMQSTEFNLPKDPLLDHTPEM